MRKDLLKASEIEFFSMYPAGFQDPELEIIMKKHKVVKMKEMAQEMFGKNKFGFTEQIIEDMIKIISRASMVSLFEKPKFRDFARSLSSVEKDILAGGLYEILHGDMSKGYEMMLDILIRGKLAKWSLMTIIPYYYYPNREVFCKPTTVKGIVKVYELDDLVYKPRPSYSFYIEYKKQLLEMKELTHESLKQDNAMFSGFLMMMMNRIS